MIDKKEALKKLQVIPGVGNRLSEELFSIGIKKVSDLKGKNPEDLYLKICSNKGYKVDRCVLYVCRLCVYFAETEIHNPEKLKWWNWK